MSVLDRSSLQSSPLADLHAIASELSIDGFRRLRRAELIEAIIARQAGGEDGARREEARGEEAPGEETRGEKPRREEARREEARGEGPRSGGEDFAAERADERERRSAPAPAEEIVSGVVEVMANGSAFLRVSPPDPSDDDVYISSAQVRRCELVSGDHVQGPRRPPRRSERFASLVRVDTVNGRPASELASAGRFDELPAAFATEQLSLGAQDPALAAVELLAPFGKGSRVVICGGARAGKSHLLSALATALAARGDLALAVVLAGARPEELSEWGGGAVAPVAALSFAASQEAQGTAIESAIEHGRRLAARGGDAAVLIDSLDGCAPAVARRALASARNLVGGGSLTVIAVAAAPFGGETTVIALDPSLAAAGRFPALDASACWTLRAELMVGASGAQAISRRHAHL